MSAVAEATEVRAAPSPSQLPPPITVRRARGKVVVRVHGGLDLAGAVILQRVLSDLIEGQGNLDVAVEMTRATAADRVTLNAVRCAADQAHRRGAAFSVRIAPYRADRGDGNDMADGGDRAFGSHSRLGGGRSAQAFSATSSV